MGWLHRMALPRENTALPVCLTFPLFFLLPGIHWVPVLMSASGNYCRLSAIASPRRSSAIGRCCYAKVARFSRRCCRDARTGWSMSWPAPPTLNSPGLRAWGRGCPSRNWSETSTLIELVPRKGQCAERLRTESTNKLDLVRVRPQFHSCELDC